MDVTCIDWQAVATTHAKDKELLKRQLASSKEMNRRLQKDNADLRFFLKDADDRLRAAGLSR